MSNDIRTIAFYLPQFYPISENDKWWGPGFTEWTNVACAKPLFRGHCQPNIPRDLGFYDLRVAETREKQAQLAREAGIEGFCYWHYWFGNGKRLLSDVFKMVVESGNPDFPFCLCWANHSWYAKTWSTKSSHRDKLLMEQTYPGIDDYEAHFMAMLPAFKDKRYIRVNGKLLFGVFAPLDIPNACEFMDIWNRLAKENGLSGFEFFAYASGEDKVKKIRSLRFDKIVYDAYKDVFMKKSRIEHVAVALWRRYLKRPLIASYSHYMAEALKRFRQNSDCVPCLIPNFDHTPRSGYMGTMLLGSTPQKWGRLCERAKNMVLHNDATDNLLFIKAWNEWGEGNYLEPDMRWGKQYINESAKALAAEDVNDK